MTQKTDINIYEDLKKTELTLAKKGRFSYASWAQTWEEVLKYDDRATYQVHETENGWPAFINKYGGFVKVTVKIKSMKRTCMLPIISMNKAVAQDAIDTMAINTAIQRCLVKCVALFGLGLYVYQGQDWDADMDKPK